MADHDQNFPLDDADLALLRGAKGVLALTNDGREEILAVERRVAMQIAAALETTLYLADRSVRTWTETPHVRGPAGIEELRRLGVTYRHHRTLSSRTTTRIAIWPSCRPRRNRRCATSQWPAIPIRSSWTATKPPDGTA